MDITGFLPTAEANGPARQRVIDQVNSASTGEPVAPAQSSATTLGQSDFLKLLTVQLQQQDPFEPVDNTEMLAQMAQFSALAGTSETNDTLAATNASIGRTNAALGDIAAKLDTLIAAQTTPTNPSTTTQPETGQ